MGGCHTIEDLLKAIIDGDMERVDRIINSGIIDINQSLYHPLKDRPESEAEMNTPLMFAMHDLFSNMNDGDEIIAIILVKASANLGICNDRGQNALIIASENTHPL